MTFQEKRDWNDSTAILWFRSHELPET